MRQAFDNLGRQGVIYDQPAWEVPANAWTYGQNVRFHDGAAESVQGHSQVFGSLSGDGYRLFSTNTGTEYFWVYADINYLYATDGTSHADITGSSASYSAGDTLYWNGGPFQGYIVMNNGKEDPVSWAPSLGNNTLILANWDTNVKADVIRPFRNFLFALGCTESGTYNPRLLRHSNGAGTAALPTSWDYTDPSEDTGRVEFGQTSDALIDCAPLRDTLVIYKENHTWAAQATGGVDNPFVYRQVFSQLGALSQDCIQAIEGRHIVLSSDDVVIHDLNTVQSIVDKRTRNFIFNSINPTYYRNSYIVLNRVDREAWICIPYDSAQFPNLAMIWNWAENTISFKDIGFECPAMGFGVVEPNTGVTFAADTGTFAEASGVFDELAYNPTVTSILMSDHTNNKLFQVDESGQYDGISFAKTLIREALPLDDFQRFKHVKRIFPKIIGEPGDTVAISVGTRNAFNDSVMWSQAQTYTIGTDQFVNFREMGRIIDVRFVYAQDNNFRLHGFDIEYDYAGLY